MMRINKITALALTSVMMVGIIPAAAMADSVKQGWIEKDGKWYYYEDGFKVRSSVRYCSDKDGKCLLDASGVRVDGKKGWVTIKTQYSSYGDKYKASVKYYLKSDGTVYNGVWKKISGKYYFFDYNGKMVKNTTGGVYDIDLGTSRYYLAGSDGVRITKKGWHKVSYVKYDSFGKKSTTKVWYYLKSGGEAVTGIKKISGKTYLFDRYGALVQNNYAAVDKGSYYDFYAADKNGEIITKKGWHKLKYTSTYDNGRAKGTSTSTHKVYVNKDGKLATGLKKIDGKYYYFGPLMYCQQSWLDQEKNEMHYFGKDGAQTYVVKDYN